MLPRRVKFANKKNVRKSRGMDLEKKAKKTKEREKRPRKLSKNGLMVIQ